MHRSFTISVAFICSLILVGCGGSSVDADAVEVPYPTLFGGASQTSTLVGSGARRQSTVSGVLAVPVSGELTHDTLEITITDGVSSLSDSDGMNALGEFTEGENNLILGGTQNVFEGDIAAGLEYLTVFKLEDDTSILVSSTIGVVGIGTQLIDMPAAGSVAYNGLANVFMGNLNGGSNYAVLRDGLTVVSVDFQGGLVDVDFNHTGPSSVSGDITGPPIDALFVEGMQIDGNGFSGGEITMYLDGVIVDPVGPGAVESANGHFFGFDEGNLIPDEVGGTIISSDGLSSVVVLFVAD